MKRIYLFLFLVPLLIFSCSKEKSVETGAKPGDSSATTSTGDTCKLSKIVEADSASGKAEYAYISSFNPAHQAVTLDVVDSASNAIDNSFSISYLAGKIQLDPQQYFLVGSDGKITEFHGFEYPDYNQGEKFTVKYTYNAAGQLTLRTETYDTLPNVVLYQMKFTYAGGNLASEQIEARAGATFVKVADVTYSYDVSKPIKEALYLYGLAPELTVFQFAVNAGTKNTNPLTKTVVSFKDPNTGVASILNTIYQNYLIDAKGYVQRFDVSGNDFTIGGFSAKKRYRLSYNCH